MTRPDVHARLPWRRRPFLPQESDRRGHPSARDDTDEAQGEEDDGRWLGNQRQRRQRRAREAAVREDDVVLKVELWVTRGAARSGWNQAHRGCPVTHSRRG